MKRNKSIISRERKQALVEFQKSLSIRFKNLELLNTALSHKSYVNESREDLEDNEKLEFLGDAFLGLVISDYLYNQNLYLKEGTLARIKSYVVSEQTLYRIGKEINIQKYLLLGRGEEKSGGRYRKALISDGIEALIGAYYIDGGYKQARKLVEMLFYNEIVRVEKNRHVKDYKSILQEFSQKQYKIIPQYNIIDIKGPDHRRKFFVNVTIKKKTFGPGIGESKKQAEQKAAGIALGELIISKRLRDPNIEKTIETRQREKRGKSFVRYGERSKYSDKDA